MMVGVMRWTALLLLPALAGAAEIGGSSVRTVYVMPMGHGLDQHVANRLTREHVLEVVADPARADALFTDSLGKPLEYELEKLHPTPKPPEQDAESESAKDTESKSAKNDASKPDKDAGSKSLKDDSSKSAKDDASKSAKDDASKPDKDAGSKSAKDDSTAAAKPAAHKVTENAEPPRSTFGSGKGTLFLVDANSRRILWSVYERPKRYTPDELERTAKRVVDRLKQDLAGK